MVNMISVKSVVEINSISDLPNQMSQRVLPSKEQDGLMVVKKELISIEN